MDVSSNSSESSASILLQSLVDQLKSNGNIVSPGIEAAFRSVPRHLFLPHVPLEEVYRDQAIVTRYQNGNPVSSSSQPAIMAIMLEQLQLEAGHHVLEIGAGTGYNAALMAHIVGDTGQITTIDIDEDIVETAREHIEAAGFHGVQVICGDGGLGYPDAAPYDRIILTVGARDILPAWREQMKPNGRLLLPLTLRDPQVSAAFEQAGDHLASTSISCCRFMPLRGAFAESGFYTQLGPEPGLNFGLAERGPVDVEAVYQFLIGPSRDLSTQVQLRLHQLFFSLQLWLALYEPDFCRLYAEGAIAERSIVPNLFSSAANTQTFHTIGVFGKTSLCLLMRSPYQASTEDDTLGLQAFELFVRCYGTDDTVAHHLIKQIAAWDAAGRPAEDRLLIQAYPQNFSPLARKQSKYMPAEGEIVIQEQWTRLVLKWQSQDNESR